MKLTEFDQTVKNKSGIEFNFTGHIQISANSDCK